MATTAQTVTYVQNQPQQLVTHHIHHAKLTRIYRLPEEIRKKSYYLGISCLVNGLLCLFWGCIGYVITNERLFILSTGINIVCGVFFSIAGIFGIVTFKNTNDTNLMHSYYAFIVIAFIAALFQIVFSSITYVYVRYFHNALVYNIISTLFSLVSFSQSLAGLIILSQNIYCKGSCPTTTATTIYPGQPGQVQVINAYGSPQPLMMTPVNIPVNRVVYYNAGMVPNAGDPQVHFASQSHPQPQLQPPQQPPPPPQDFQHELPHQQFQPLPTIKK